MQRFDESLYPQKSGEERALERGEKVQQQAKYWHTGCQLQQQTRPAAAALLGASGCASGWRCYQRHSAHHCNIAHGHGRLQAPPPDADILNVLKNCGGGGKREKKGGMLRECSSGQWRELDHTTSNAADLSLTCSAPLHETSSVESEARSCDSLNKITAAKNSSLWRQGKCSRDQI